ncbi:hypothetical protein [Egbenema bharatensis]|uniref:hypothetical protein n=1 Tax=Egbenema bharatensis TaxID=3463334 RepID=UPI003A8A98EF
MSWTPLADRLPHLPLVLAGPILRRTESDSVTVWLALQKPCEVTLSVYATAAGDGIRIKEDAGEARSPLLAGTRSTVALGQNLHIVAVTARSLTEQTLVPGQVYVYDLHFGNGERECRPWHRLSMPHRFRPYPSAILIISFPVSPYRQRT